MGGGCSRQKKVAGLLGPVRAGSIASFVVVQSSAVGAVVLQQLVILLSSCWAVARRSMG